MNPLHPQAALAGKLFLIGLTFLNESGSEIEEWETSGTVEELTDEGLLKFRRADGSLFCLPYEPATIHRAGKGDYFERATGAVITDPDFITTWKIKVHGAEDIAVLKREGYLRSE